MGLISRVSSRTYRLLFLKMELLSYYNYLFPMKDYIRWLSYEGKPDIYNSQKQAKTTLDYLSRREISMTLPGDHYIRYQTIEHEMHPEETLDQRIESQANIFKQMLNKKQPIKIDIGAIYNNCPK